MTGFNYQQERDFFCLHYPLHPPIHWLPGSLLQKHNCQAVKPATELDLVLKARTSTPTYVFMMWCLVADAQGQVYLCTYPSLFSKNKTCEAIQLLHDTRNTSRIFILSYTNIQDWFGNCLWRFYARLFSTIYVAFQSHSSASRASNNDMYYHYSKF
jgi:hypothetical protein